MTFTGHIAGTVALSTSSFDVRTYGAKGDGIADDTAAVQAAVDAAYAQGGGTVHFPVGVHRCNVTLRTGVTLLGASGSAGYGTSNGEAGPRLASITQAAAGYAVNGNGVTNAAIRGLQISGLGAGTAGGGIRLLNSAKVSIHSVMVDNFADEGIVLDSSCGACVIEDVLTTNVVLNRSRAAVVGAVDVSGTDHFLSRVEATVSGSLEGRAQSASLYCVALAVRMTNGMVSNCIGETSDVGILVSGSQNRFTGCRADLNYGHGWQVTGSRNQMAACLALNNSQDTTNAYDGFYTAGTKNLSVGSISETTTAKLHRYAFNDAAAGSDANKNVYIAPYASGSIGTAWFNFNQFAGPASLFPSGPRKTFANADTAPDVTGYQMFATNNSSPTTITTLAGAVYGQVIDVYAGDANTTLQHNGSGFSFYGGDVKLKQYSNYRLKYDGSWRLMSQDVFSLANAMPDRGDAAKTLQALRDEPTQVWATALTAPRAVALSATGAYPGARFRIVRRASSTGASTLDVGTGPLKSLATGTWCDVEYDGSAWVLTGYGSL